MIAALRPPARVAPWAKLGMSNKTAPCDLRVLLIALVVPLLQGVAARYRGGHYVLTALGTLLMLTLTV